MALQGKSANREWGVQVTPATKNLDSSTSAGSIVRYNKATGQTEVVQQPGQRAASGNQKFTTGQIYVDGNGNGRKYNGSGWEPV